jgi:hypothetical protein
MTLQDLCEIIALPPDVTTSVLEYDKYPEVREAEQHAALLSDRQTWSAGIQAIAATLGDDPAGMKMLAFMLRRALETHERYIAAGVDDQIFADTMKFCTRFVVDHYRNHGTYAFTWGWWLPRQLSFNEFRVGALEYELVQHETGRSISIHIPGDADLRAEALQDSLRRAVPLIARVAPSYAGADMMCDSWMLSPVLRELLPPASRILAFASAFDLIEVDPGNRHAIRWIFGRDDLAMDQLAEGTSLQRKAKALFIAGGNIGSAIGRLRQDAWL